MIDAREEGDTKEKSRDIKKYVDLGKFMSIDTN